MDWHFNKTFHHNQTNSSAGAEFNIVENKAKICYENVWCSQSKQTDL